jgi:hypothetical protein
MSKILRIRGLSNPAYGIKEVEFSTNEIEKYRASNLGSRNTGTHGYIKRSDENDS